MNISITILSVVVILAQATCTFALQPSSSLLHGSASFNLSTIPPSQDPFYQVPKDVADYPLGHIFRSRKLSDTTSVYGPDAGDTYQLLYRTSCVHLKPDATVTTVIAPKNPAKGPPKIVAIASPEDSPAVDCAMSWALYPHSNSKEAIGGIGTSVAMAAAALFNGYYVTLPDQEGSKAGWLAYSEGQAVLDSIRAIVKHRPTIPDSKGYQVGLMGYSGGGHGAAWAAQLASTYGKGIPIVALAAGGIPIDAAADLLYLDGKIAAGLAFAGLAGLANVYPEYDDYLQSILRPNGTEAFKALRNGSECIIQSEVNLAYKSFAGSVTDINYLSSPASKMVLEESYLGKHQKPITDFPIYQLHSQADDVVPYAPAFAYYQSQCSQGAKIAFSNPTTGDHIPTGSESIPSLLFFIKGIFEGTASISQCHQMTEYLIPYNGAEAVAIVGQNVVNGLNAAIAAAVATPSLA